MLSISPSVVFRGFPLLAVPCGLTGPSRGPAASPSDVTQAAPGKEALGFPSPSPVASLLSGFPSVL